LEIPFHLEVVQGFVGVVVEFHMRTRHEQTVDATRTLMRRYETELFSGTLLKRANSFGFKAKKIDGEADPPFNSANNCKYQAGNSNLQNYKCDGAQGNPSWSFG
jgi:hypothetical protein